MRILYGSPTLRFCALFGRRGGTSSHAIKAVILERKLSYGAIVDCCIRVPGSPFRRLAKQEGEASQMPDNETVEPPWAEDEKNDRGEEP
jgi:hypothetical protein